MGLLCPKHITTCIFNVIWQYFRHISNFCYSWIVPGQRTFMTSSLFVSWSLLKCVLLPLNYLRWVGPLFPCPQGGQLWKLQLQFQFCPIFIISGSFLFQYVEPWHSKIEILLLFLNLSLYWKISTFTPIIPLLSFLLLFFLVWYLLLLSHRPHKLYCYLLLLCQGSPKSYKLCGLCLGFLATFYCCFIIYCKNYWWRNKKTWFLIPEGVIHASLLSKVSTDMFDSDVVVFLWHKFTSPVLLYFFSIVSLLTLLTINLWKNFTMKPRLLWSRNLKIFRRTQRCCLLTVNYDQVNAHCLINASHVINAPNIIGILW